MVNLESMTKTEILAYRAELLEAKNVIDLKIKQHISALDAKQGAYKVMMNS